ncbi:hypothetical protein [Leptolyngbya sp. NIES-2104]|uniref:hypothetical protein n=1 Tax=Leptolyngbya sp. NIES-2104 TaxID=1552121 RepID=UPI0006ECCBCE|nr:hypothetical protein [Leptolyngbya sp. NIES-2104]GAP99075.1 hypothetical protein NIES2104_56320 [Leptolyngbya sp. NIES-2104]
MTKKDEAITQIRKVRHMISEEHGHEPQKLVDYYIELQKSYPDFKSFKDQSTETVQSSV